MWKTAMLSYIAKNYRYVAEKLADISGLKVMKLEASYFVWINYAETNLTSQEVNKLLLNTNWLLVKMMTLLKLHQHVLELILVHPLRW
ncbi:hypothetical protein [Spiroplasma endosymbiont of Phyllotreta cruciferae]|uniref:hypothetical protein n=1 Tax=Spiroplasma endosymbiont of Phyllotreta cruciferae TaxID=2886375 RepID=UPI0020A20606|nr:hypothetical protein [Spiroplasma endosymbiont of Phyllotreta cruciferae]